MGDTMKIVRNTITLDELKAMAAAGFGTLVKAVVDVQTGVMAVDGDLHSTIATARRTPLGGSISMRSPTPSRSEGDAEPPTEALQQASVSSPISVEAAQIAAIARVAGLSLATRNVKDFSGIDGLNIIDPWSA